MNETRYQTKRYPLACEEFENKNKKEQKIFDLRGDLNPRIFSIFPAHDLNFHGK